MHVYESLSHIEQEFGLWFGLVNGILYLIALQPGILPDKMLPTLIMKFNAI